MQRLCIIPAFLAIFTSLGFKHSLAVPHYTSSVVDSCQWDVVLDGSSFRNYPSFEANWNYLYPWGNDHNGSARMIAGKSEHDYVSLRNKILRIKARYITTDEGNSSKNPHLKIKYF